MNNSLKSDIISWLRQGKQLNAADLTERCDIELIGVDLIWEEDTEREFMLTDVVIYAPRDIYEANDVDFPTQIEKALQHIIDHGHLIRRIEWKGKVEKQTNSPSQVVTIDSLRALGAERVKLDWQRAIDRLSRDPEGAITASRTLIESICKIILDNKELFYDKNDDLPKLYRKTADILDLIPDKQSNDNLRRILGGIQNIVSGIGEMRNQLGDAHGKSENTVIPETRHAALAVNLAGALAVFLVETWQSQAQQDSGTSSND